MRTTRIAVCLALVGLCAAARAEAASGGVRDLWFHQVPRVKTPPVIDGKRDDACWKTLPVLSNFGRDRFSLKSTHPLLPMRVQLGFDERYLYCLWWIGSPEGKYKLDYAELRRKQEARMNETEMWWNPPSLEFRVDGNRDRLGETSIQMNMVGQKQAMHKIATGWSTEYAEGWDIWADYKYASGYDPAGWWIELRVSLKDLGAEARPGYVMGAQFRYFHVGAYFAWTPGGYNPQYYGDLLLVEKPLPMSKALELIMPDFRTATIRMPQPDGVVVVKNGRTSIESYKDTIMAEVNEIRKQRADLAAKLKVRPGMDAKKVMAPVDQALDAIDAALGNSQTFSASDMTRLREPLAAADYVLRDAQARIDIHDLMRQ